MYFYTYGMKCWVEALFTAASFSPATWKPFPLLYIIEFFNLLHQLFLNLEVLFLWMHPFSSPFLLQIVCVPWRSQHCMWWRPSLACRVRLIEPHDAAFCHWFPHCHLQLWCLTGVHFRQLLLQEPCWKAQECLQVALAHQVYLGYQHKKYFNNAFIILHQVMPPDNCTLSWFMLVWRLFMHCILVLLKFFTGDKHDVARFTKEAVQTNVIIGHHTTTHAWSTIHKK